MNAKEISNIIVIPVTICVIGVWATFQATSTQNKNAKDLADSQYELSEKHHAQDVNLQVTNEFFRLFETSDVCQSSKRIGFLIGEAGPKRAATLEELFIEHCKRRGVDEIEQIAESAKTAVNDARLKEINGLISDLQGTGRRVARTKLTKLYEEDEKLVAGQLTTAIKANFNDYRTTLGILDVLSTVEGGWTPTGELLNEFERLKNSPNMKDETFKKVYSEAKNNKSKRYHVVVVSATKKGLAQEFKQRLISEGFKQSKVFKTSKGYGVTLGEFSYKEAKELQSKFESLDRFHPNYPNKADLYETKPSIKVVND